MALSALVGCATMSKGECLTADWYQIGIRDGSNGYQRSRLYEHRKACAEYGVSPNVSAYYAGRKKGLYTYCTPRNGFREGRAGHQYRDVCPVSLEAEFLAEFRKGRAIYEVRQAIKSVQVDIDRLGRKLSDDDTNTDTKEPIRFKLDNRFDELDHLNNRLERLRLRYAYE